MASGDSEWLVSLYSDRMLITQLDGDDSAWHPIRETGPASGRPSSSSTQPRLMAGCSKLWVCRRGCAYWRSAQALGTTRPCWRTFLVRTA